MAVQMKGPSPTERGARDHAFEFFREFAPPATVHRLVEQAWLLRCPPQSEWERQFTALPEGHPTLLFNLADQVVVHTRHGRVDLPQGVHLVGQMRHPMQVGLGLSSCMLGFRLFPWSLAALRLDATAVTDRVVTLGAPWRPAGEDLAQLGQMLGDVSRAPREAMALAALVLSRQPTAEVSERLIVFVTRLARIAAHERRVMLKDLSSGESISLRSIERGFRKTIGLTPKDFAQIVRFRRVIERLRQGPMPWTHLAQLSGYYDQAHLIHAFQRYAGTSPQRFLDSQSSLTKLFAGVP